MPTYEYRCKACGQELEVVQSFTDDALTTCEACGGQLRKVFGNVGIAFKGSGFYKNDSRGKSTAAPRAPTRAATPGRARATTARAATARKRRRDEQAGRRLHLQHRRARQGGQAQDELDQPLSPFRAGRARR